MGERESERVPVCLLQSRYTPFNRSNERTNKLLAVWIAIRPKAHSYYTRNLLFIICLRVRTRSSHRRPDTFNLDKSYETEVEKTQANYISANNVSVTNATNPVYITSHRRAANGWRILSE